MQNVHEKRLLRVIEYIHANPAGDLSLDALADVAAMSRFHWHRVFHAMTGETAADAVRRVRLHRAACWLVQKPWPIAEVAARVGYPNLRSFARAFERSYGRTPSAFREQGEMTSPLTLLRKGNTAMFDVSVKEEPARRLAALSHTGPYIEIGRAFEKVSAMIASRNLFPQVRGMAGLYFDDPAAVPEAELQSKAGVILADGAEAPEGLEAVDVDGGRFAVLRFKGPYSGLKEGYDYLFGAWLAQSDEEPRDAPAMEVYLNAPTDVAPEELLTDICMPLK